MTAEEGRSESPRLSRVCRIGTQNRIAIPAEVLQEVGTEEGGYVAFVLQEGVAVMGRADVLLSQEFKQWMGEQGIPERILRPFRG